MKPVFVVMAIAALSAIGIYQDASDYQIDYQSAAVEINQQVSIEQ